MLPADYQTLLLGTAAPLTLAQAARLSTRRFRIEAGFLLAAPVGGGAPDDLTAFELVERLAGDPERLMALAADGRCPAPQDTTDGIRTALAAFPERWRAPRERQLERGELEAVALEVGSPWPPAGEPGAIAYRLRRLRETPGPRLKAGDGAGLAEAAGVVARQALLGAALGDSVPALVGARPEAVWRSEPAWRHGYDLARRTREALSLTATAPIPSLRALVEDRLGISVIQLPLSRRVAGATVVVGHRRGIVLNTQGGNENVWLRRITLAHELCHLLWDPDEALHTLHLDEYATLEGSGVEPEEQRANAFAVALLAPPDAARDHFEQHLKGPGGELEALRAVMKRFGLSRRASQHHLGNAGCPQAAAARPSAEPTDEWRAAENATLDYLTLGQPPLREARAGRFAGLVVRALQEGVLSAPVAAAWLGISRESLEPGWLKRVAEAFPDVFTAADMQRAAARSAERQARFTAELDALPRVEAEHPTDWVALLGGVVVDHDPQYDPLVERLQRRGYAPRDLLFINPAQRYSAA